MDELKCPFCNGGLERVYSRPFQLICGKCGSLGTDELWQELIRTRKALDVAVDALKLLNSEGKRTRILGLISITDTALDKIKTTLKQKE
jgi:hypothetical protein